jgi:hypothetical protein
MLKHVGVVMCIDCDGLPIVITLQSHYFTFCRLGGDASEEATSVQEKYRDCFENVGPDPWQLEAIRRTAEK